MLQTFHLGPILVVFSQVWKFEPRVTNYDICKLVCTIVHTKFSCGVSNVSTLIRECVIYFYLVLFYLVSNFVLGMVKVVRTQPIRKNNDITEFDRWQTKTKIQTRRLNERSKRDSRKEEDRSTILVSQARNTSS